MPIPNLDALIAMKQYPGMREPDSAVFRKWLQHRGAFYDRVEWRYLLGEGTAPDPSWSDPVKALHRDQTAKKLDALAWIGNQPVIVEGKSRAALKDIGQVLGYYDLFVKQHPDLPEPEMLIICDDVDPDVAHAANSRGISIEVYG